MDQHMPSTILPPRPARLIAMATLASLTGIATVLLVMLA